MDKDLLIIKRYVKGLRLAAIILFGLYLMGLATVIFVPGIQTLLVTQLATCVMVAGIIIFGGIATLIKDNNYGTCLFFAISMQIIFPFSLLVLFNYNNPY